MSIKARVQDLRAQGDALFSRRSGIMSLWQEQAENFYPTRADFTRHDPWGYTEGRDFMDGLMTGSPVLAHRELSDQFAAMLRPKGKDWFGMTVEDERVATGRGYGAGAGEGGVGGGVDSLWKVAGENIAVAES